MIGIVAPDKPNDLTVKVKIMNWKVNWCLLDLLKSIYQKNKTNLLEIWYQLTN